MEGQIIPSNKNGKKLIFGGYIFHCENKTSFNETVSLNSKFIYRVVSHIVFISIFSFSFFLSNRNMYIVSRTNILL